MTREEILQYAWVIVRNFCLEISWETLQLIPEDVLTDKIRGMPYHDLCRLLRPYEELERARRMMTPKQRQAAEKEPLTEGKTKPETRRRKRWASVQPLIRTLRRLRQLVTSGSRR